MTMKIKFITSVGGTSTPATIETLDLCGQGLPEGNATGLLPIKLPGDVIMTPQLQVTSGTTKSRRGVTSAVLKVSLPYTALARDTTGEHVVADPKGSNGYVSMHVVLALPQSAVRDLKSSDSTINQAAYAQIAAVSQILRTLLSQGLMERTGVVDAVLAGSVDMTTDAVDAGAHVEVKRAKPIHFSTQGSVGLDLTSVGPVPANLDNLVTRVASGLPPLSCGDVSEMSIVTPVA
jgi:hypothetical protein